MRTPDRHEKWLILDDNRLDRFHIEHSLVAFADRVEFVHAAVIHEAKEILERQKIDLCLMDFYLKGGTQADALIPDLRKRWGNIPIVVVSHKADEDGEGNVALFDAGADAVVAKLDDLKSFGKALRKGILHAKRLRWFRAGWPNLQEVYVGNALEESLQIALSRRQGNILISAPRGMGKTSAGLSALWCECRVTFNYAA